MKKLLELKNIYKIIIMTSFEYLKEVSDKTSIKKLLKKLNFIF